MTDKNTGGPSFPIGTAFQGLTMRDYFAAKAIAGLLLDDDGDFSDPDWLAEHAYKVADAMLKARDVK